MTRADSLRRYQPHYLGVYEQMRGIADKLPVRIRHCQGMTSEDTTIVRPGAVVHLARERPVQRDAQHGLRQGAA